jgi:hypothetical protein
MLANTRGSHCSVSVGLHFATISQIAINNGTTQEAATPTKPDRQQLLLEARAHTCLVLPADGAFAAGIVNYRITNAWLPSGLAGDHCSESSGRRQIGFQARVGEADHQPIRLGPLPLIRTR